MAAKVKGNFAAPFKRKACKGLTRRGHKWCPCREAKGRFAPNSKCA